MPTPSRPPSQPEGVFRAPKSHSGRTNESGKPYALEALVLLAFDEVEGFPSEVTPWREAYDFKTTVMIDGSPSPVRVTQDGLGIVTTGVGKLAAATTMAALTASERIDLGGALIMNVGVAGGPPDVGVGSVIIADSIADWDHKYRVDPDQEDETIAINPHTGGTAFTLNRDLVEWAMEIAGEVDLSAPEINGRIGSADTVVSTGTNLCGDELWHGRELARQAVKLVDQHGEGTYRATEMEDAGTAYALDQFGYLDQYLSIRGISNHDRPAAGLSGMQSLRSSDFDEGFEHGIRNAFRIAREIVERRIR